MVNFFSWLPAQVLVGTSGRAIDHIGFEVRNRPEFLQRLEAKGVTIREAYRRVPELGNIGVAAFTDPWGTSIELTEDLRELR